MDHEGVNLLPDKFYKPYDVVCDAIPNHYDIPNMYSTSCAAKLAMEEPHIECLKCKGLWNGRTKKPTKNDEVRERQRKYQFKYRQKTKPRKEYTCKECGVIVPDLRHYCDEHRHIGVTLQNKRDAEKQTEKRRLKRKGG